MVIAWENFFVIISRDEVKVKVNILKSLTYTDKNT